VLFPILVLDVDNEVVWQFGDGITVRSIANRARLTRRAAATRPGGCPHTVDQDGLRRPSGYWRNGRKISLLLLATNGPEQGGLYRGRPAMG
jgi:hypothetical protein